MHTFGNFGGLTKKPSIDPRTLRRGRPCAQDKDGKKDSKKTVVSNGGGEKSKKKFFWTLKPNDRGGKNRGGRGGRIC